MSRSIHISYTDPAGKDIKIEIRAPYYMFGHQQSSEQFWSIPYLKEIGIERLTILGEMDPVYFTGWDEMAVLGREIEVFAKNLESIDFYPELKTRWLSHLTFCYRLLIATPRECTPKLWIG